MYSLSDYGHMIADKARMDPYAYAIKAAVTDESIVMDIGAGTGIHALLACKFGARKVYAVEPNDVIHLARKLAQINGYSDRIIFIQDNSTNISLPEKADVIVSDLRGVLPLLGLHIPSIIDARNRHLSIGGALIPKRDTLWAALVEARFLYRGLTRPWEFPYGLSMEPARKIALNNYSDFDTGSLQSRNRLTEPGQWAILDYGSIDKPDIASSLKAQSIVRNGTAYGWLVWFDSELSEGISFFNGPDVVKISSVYGRAFFPLSDPVPVSTDDRVDFSIQAKLKGDTYEWEWQTRFVPAADQEPVEFTQSTANTQLFFEGERNIGDLRPGITVSGELDLLILSMLDGNNSIEQIASQAIATFPTRFDDLNDAFFYVYDLSRQYAI